MDNSRRMRRRQFVQGVATVAAAGIVTPQIVAGAATPAPADKDAWQIGCFTRPWADHEYRVALDAIAEAGFKYAGLMTQGGTKDRLIVSVATTPEQAAEVGQEVKKRGLKVPCLWGGDFGAKKAADSGIEGLRRLIDNCAAVGSPALMIGGTGAADLYEAYYKIIADCCGYAAEKKVEMVLKPHGGLNATGTQCRKTIELVGHRSFRLWYDPGNIFFYSDGKLDPVDDVGSVAGLVTGMCVKDFTMKTEGEKITKEVAVTPGTGRVNFKAVFAGLKKGGFAGGPLVVECLARGELPALLAEAKKARQLVESLVA